MALRRALTKRLLHNTKFINPRVSVPPNAAKTNMHREHLPTTSPLLSFPLIDNLKDKLNNINNEERVRFDIIGFDQKPRDVIIGEMMSVEDAKKITRLAKVERLKMKIRDFRQSSIAYDEFVKVCEGDEEFAKVMDETGNVVVLGDVVFLRPEQVAKSMESLIFNSIALPNDPRRKELAEMEKKKAIIDEKAIAQVRGELYCGLGLMMVQTLGFMRLTFWELSWDVMEPICFFVTSLHFFIGYGFFIRTSREPTFEGFFKRRFEANQRRLMEKYNFDVGKYYELCRACYLDD